MKTRGQCRRLRIAGVELVLAAMGLLMAGCGPIYSTQYVFDPPTSPQGQSCIFQCENSKMQCEQLQDLRTENCEERSEAEYYRCKNRDEKHCYRQYCSTDYTRCEENYRRCYQSCGGSVRAEKVCVGFCQ